jgi:DMSO/TMAO reductase YedYZ molybdopterin-dependent catalytic subunit
MLSAKNRIPHQREASHVGSGMPGTYYYHQQVRNVAPIHPDYWSFTVDTMGQTRLILSYEDLLALPASDTNSTLICSGNGSSRIDTSIWRGVSIPTLLDRLNIRGRYARFLAADGYVTGLTLESLTQAMLVYAMNGEPLSHEHGFPARLLAPGHYGYKMPKWITRMELTDVEPIGFWEARGWSASGAVRTTATIISPRHQETARGSIIIRGRAYAGERGIGQIEVNIDDGPWMPVVFEPALPYCLTEWRIQWTPPTVGDYLIKVRASDGASQNEAPSNRGVVVRIIEI